MATTVVGDLYFALDGQFLEIKRQLRQKGGYPYEPQWLVEHLQAAIQGTLVDRDGKSFLASAPDVPPNDEWFELEVDDTIDPMEVVISSGENPVSWKYLGPNFKGRHTYPVKLIRIDSFSTLTEARKRADQMGYRLVEGQARESFRAKFPRSDHEGPVVFGGSAWQHPDGMTCITCLATPRGERWHSYFVAERQDGWRWLVTNK